MISVFYFFHLNRLLFGFEIMLLFSHSHSFIHSFRLFLFRLFKSPTSQRRSWHSMETVPEFHAEAPRATVSEGLAQGPYVAARAGVEPTTLRTKGVDSTNTPCFSSFRLKYFQCANVHISL